MTIALGRERATARGAQANLLGANVVTTSGQPSHHYDPTAYVARKLWPAKTAEHLADYLGCSVRHAKYLLSPTTSKKAISVAFIKRMLLGKHGGEFLKAWMTDSDAEWWQRLVELEQKQAEQEEKLKAIRDAMSGV